MLGYDKLSLHQTYEVLSWHLVDDNTTNIRKIKNKKYGLRNSSLFVLSVQTSKWQY